MRLVHHELVKEQHETYTASDFFHLGFDYFGECWCWHLESLVTYARDSEVGYCLVTLQGVSLANKDGYHRCCRLRPDKEPVDFPSLPSL